MPLLYLLSLCAVAVFAISGALSAGHKKFDVLSGETPLLLRDRELYATAAIAGSIVYLLLFRWVGLELNLSVLIGVSIIVLLRTGSLLLKLRVPVYHVMRHDAP